MKRILFLNGAFFILTASMLLFAPPAGANVFPSNIRINGGVTNAIAAPGDQVEISYILNERATRGVTVEVLQGLTVVRRLTLSTNGPGTDPGVNHVTWDLRDNSSTPVAGGSYSVRVTAAADGYEGWTQISPEGALNTLVFDGHGITSLQKQDNPYAGRLVVANSAAGDPTTPGHLIGFVKLNADGSDAEEGISSTGGRNWTGNYVSPWKVEAWGDFVYANDLAVGGQLFRWDPTISPDSMMPVLRADNLPIGASLGGFALSGQETNAQLWMADRASTLGVLKWNLGPDGTCANADTGVTVVGVGSDPTGLTLPPQDVALDRAGNIYVCQAVSGETNSLQRVFRFPAYDPSTNGGAPLLTASWAVGATDDTYGGASGIAVDPTGTYVAVAFQGVSLFGLTSGGNTKILYATNGALVTSLDLGLEINGDPTHQDTDCAWDEAGNVYYIDNWWGRWRAVSPPGTNQMAAVAPAMILVSGSAAPPQVTGITVSNGVVRLTFTASASDSANDFVVLSSSGVAGPYVVVSTASVSATSPGVFTAILPVSGASQFYRVDRKTSQSQQPEIQGISVASGTVSITFSGAATDAPTAFTLLSAGSPEATFTPVQNAQFSGSAGAFRVTTATNGPARFYRIQR